MRGSKRHDERFTAASFLREDDAIAAVSEARSAGFDIHDVFTPFPVHGMDDAMGLRRSRLTRISLIGAALGVAGGIGLQVWTSAFDWPLNVGGKAFASLPAFVPVTFELAVLFSGLMTVAAFLIVSRLRPSRRRFIFDGVTDDRFVVVVREQDAVSDPADLQRIFRNHRPIAIHQGVQPQ